MSPIPILVCGHEKTKLGLMARLHWRRERDRCVHVGGWGRAGHEVGSHHCIAASAKAAGYNDCDLGDLQRGGKRGSPYYQLWQASCQLCPAHLHTGHSSHHAGLGLGGSRCTGPARVVKEDEGNSPLSTQFCEVCSLQVSNKFITMPTI